MARRVKEEDYIARRREILDVSYRLVYTKGFDQITIQDILNESRISKGAFYHYFNSKSDIQEALVERIVDEIEPALIALVQDPQHSAIDKLQGYFETANKWKTAHKSMVLSLLRVWYADENAVLRQKVFNSTLERITPWITEIINQGVAEGVFATRYPESICQMFIYLLQGLSDAIVGLMLIQNSDITQVQKAEQVLAAYNDAIERILGAPSGSIRLLEKDSLEKWFV